MHADHTREPARRIVVGDAALRRVRAYEVRGTLPVPEADRRRIRADALPPARPLIELLDVSEQPRVVLEGEGLIDGRLPVTEVPHDLPTALGEHLAGERERDDPRQLRPR